MTTSTAAAPPDSSAGGKFLPILLLLFVGSGCSALVYEVVWLQLLKLVIGTSSVSMGVLLGTFMGGMCLGSLLFPRFVKGNQHPLKLYAWLELAIAAFGLLLLYGMPLIDVLYASIAPSGGVGIVLRAIIAAVCLLPPTICMGATLPAISRWLETTPKGISWLGFFYGCNTAGAVFGTLLAGFYLLRVYDMAFATWVAVGINVAVALIALLLSTVTPHVIRTIAAPAVVASRAPAAWTVYLAIGLSGMNALGAEVIYTRQLSLMLGATVYTFSIILAVFLVGIGIGSSVGSMVSNSALNSRWGFAWCQLLLVGALYWTGYMLSRSLPYWPIEPGLTLDPNGYADPWIMFQLDLARCFWAVLPPALLWGASFPLALGAVASPGQDPGRLVGGVYAANTLGAIIGALVASLIAVQTWGTHGTQQVFIGFAAVSAVLAFLPLMVIELPDGVSAAQSRVAAALCVMLAAGASVAAVTKLPESPWQLIGYGRRMITEGNGTLLDEYREGMNASIAVSHWGETHSFHVSGKVVASALPEDMRLQRMLGHLPGLIHPNPKTVLVVGCGAGVTAGSFMVHPTVERIVICEIEPEIPPLAGKYFGPEQHYVIRQAGVSPEGRTGPEVVIVNDDARHYVLTTDEKFDIITSDPIHPWVKGAAALYSKEYFELCNLKLNPGGVVTQWVPLYESSAAAVKSEIATFMEVYPHGTIWSNDIGGDGYDIVLLGQIGEMTIDLDALDARFNAPDRKALRQSMVGVNFFGPAELLGTYAGQGTDLGDYVRGAEINLDSNLRLQFLAGMGLNTDDEIRIFNDILKHRKYPENLFRGSEERVSQMKVLLSGLE